MEEVLETYPGGQLNVFFLLPWDMEAENLLGSPC